MFPINRCNTFPYSLPNPWKLVTANVIVILSSPVNLFSTYLLLWFLIFYTNFCAQLRRSSKTVNFNLSHHDICSVTARIPHASFVKMKMLTVCEQNHCMVKTGWFGVVTCWTVNRCGQNQGRWTARSQTAFLVYVGQRFMEHYKTVRAGKWSVWTLSH